MSSETASPRERLRERPDTLRELAESDRDSAWVYQRVREELQEDDDAFQEGGDV